MLKVKCDKAGIKKAFQIINNGGIVIFPTDTVYGIGCNPYQNDAVKKIYEIKSRDASKPVLVLAYSIEIIEKIAVFDEEEKKIMEKFWPGPLTMILRLVDKKLKKSLNLDDKIAVRIPNNKCALELLEKCELLVGTSANISGQPSFIDPTNCSKDIKSVDVFVDGGIINSDSESTIIEIDNGKIKILREGSVTKEELSRL